MIYLLYLSYKIISSSTKNDFFGETAFSAKQQYISL